MNTLKPIIKWLPVLLLCLCSLFIILMLPSYRFLAVVMLLLAAAYFLQLLLWQLRKRHKKAGAILLTVFYALVVTGLAACVWAGILIGSACKGAPATPCEYVIVLGAGVNGTTPSQSLQWRIDKAYEYLTANPQVQCIASGGQGPNEAISEARCIYDHLTKKGIDGSRIWLEERSTSTQENIRFSLDLIQSKTGTRPDTAGILSSEYHLYRAGQFAKQQDLSAVGIPARTQRPALFVSYYIREIFAVLYYSIFG